MAISDIIWDMRDETGDEGRARIRETAEDVLSSMALQEQCFSCHGCGHEAYRTSLACGACDGTGSMPTAFGREILDLVSRNLRLMLRDL